MIPSAAIFVFVCSLFDGEKIVYSILEDLTRLSGLSRNQGDECRSYQNPQNPQNPPRVTLLAAAERSIIGVSRSAGWRGGVRDGDGDLYFLCAVMSAFLKLLEQNLVAGLIQ